MRLNIFNKYISKFYLRCSNVRKIFQLWLPLFPRWNWWTLWRSRPKTPDRPCQTCWSRKVSPPTINRKWPKVTGNEEVRWSETLKADAVCRNHDRCHQCVRMDFSERCDIHKGYKFEARQDSVTQKKVKILKEMAFTLEG